MVYAYCMQVDQLCLQHKMRLAIGTSLIVPPYGEG